MSDQHKKFKRICILASFGALSLSLLPSLAFSLTLNCSMPYQENNDYHYNARTFSIDLTREGFIVSSTAYYKEDGEDKRFTRIDRNTGEITLETKHMTVRGKCVPAGKPKF